MAIPMSVQSVSRIYQPNYSSKPSQPPSPLAQQSAPAIRRASGQPFAKQGPAQFNPDTAANNNPAHANAYQAQQQQNQGARQFNSYPAVNNNPSPSNSYQPQQQNWGNTQSNPNPAANYNPAPVNSYQAQQQSLSNLPFQLKNPNGTVSQVPLSQAIRQSAWNVSNQLSNAINVLKQPQLPTDIENNLRLIFPYGVTPEVKQGLIENLQGALNVANDVASGNRPINYTYETTPRNSESADINGAAYDPNTGGLTVNAYRFTDPSQQPTSQLGLDRALTHEYTHAGAGTVDNWYIQNNGYAAWGFHGSNPGRFNPNSYQAPYLANADTNAFASLMLNRQFPLI
jgi:hypothetical protein